MANRLESSLSPYLIQHATNPVDWHPWDKKALGLAKETNRPIFLSIGYAACHWCHVMAHESFEDEQIADYLNENFVSIKVDREERPDLDHVYMRAVMAIRGGQGGWPLSVFLTPDQEVFFGGTYWPARSNAHMPGFDHVLKQVLEAYRDRRDDVQAQAAQITDFLNAKTESVNDETLNDSVLTLAFNELDQAFDESCGGFGNAPKFPHPMNLQLLVRLEKGFRDIAPQKANRCREIVEQTLKKMHAGGIYDHLAGGFARYSVDREWLVPHFEKMLYDNALLVNAYLDAYQAWNDESFREIACDTVDFVLAEMVDEEGAFHSTLDADSEGVEGKFYVWKPQEIEEVLGAEVSKLVCDWFDVTPAGNFENGWSILHLNQSLEAFCRERNLDVEQTKQRLENAKHRLLEARNKRVSPAKDDKIISSWNGLMIDAVARAGSVCQRPDYHFAANRAAKFIAERMVDDDCNLVHAYRQGKTSGAAFLDDYACLIQGLVRLYEGTLEEAWLELADRFAQKAMLHFHDNVEGDFYYTGESHEQLITRPKDWQDGSVPSGNSMICTGLLRLGACLGLDEYRVRAREVLNALAKNVRKAPTAAGQLLICYDLLRAGVTEWVLVGVADQAFDDLKRLAQKTSDSSNVLLARDSKKSIESELLNRAFLGRQDAAAKESRLYICEGFTCQQPIVGNRRIREHLLNYSPLSKPIQD